MHRLEEAMQVSKRLKIALLLGAIATFIGAPASAAPLTPLAGAAALNAQLEDASPLIEVRSRRGAAVAAGIAGAIIGGIIASQGYGYYGPYYGPYPAYPAYPAYPYAGPYDGAVAYCMRRYRSYDPYSMTYLGYDGLRHPCP
jgi:hypothetical protein